MILNENAARYEQIEHAIFINIRRVSRLSEIFKMYSIWHMCTVYVVPPCTFLKSFGIGKSSVQIFVEFITPVE